MRKNLLLLLLTIFCISCRNDIVYSRFNAIPSKEWHMDSAQCFDYRIVDQTLDYRLIVTVRHTERYPYQNMWLFLGDSLHTDTIEFYLADDRGQWLGDKHSGLIEMPVLYEEHYHFPDTGIYSLSVRHGMRDSILNGIIDIGLEIISNGKE